MAAIILPVLGLVAFAVPGECLPEVPGSWGCLSPSRSVVAKPKLIVTAGPSATVAPASSASPMVTPQQATAAGEPGAAIAASPPSALIAATFEKLGATDATSASPAATATATVAAAQPPATGTNLGPTTRLVTTTPVPADALSAYAAEPAAAATPSETPAAAVATSDPAPLPAAARPTSGSNIMVVTGGGGVTVRSGPSRSGGKVFALGPGERVTVTASRNGWLQLVDAHGRRGWAYSSYLGRP